MNFMKSFTHNENTYLLLEGIKKSDSNKAYFTGCKTMRKCIEKHNIPEDKCLFMKNDKVYTKSYKSADLYVESIYSKKYILDKEAFDTNQQVITTKKQIVVEENKKQKGKELVQKQTERKQYDEQEITEAPPEVYLEDNEMFKDIDGEPMDIEMRGDKTVEGSYFKAYDIGKTFDYKRINNTILNENSNHVYGKHYKYFLKDSVPTGGQSKQDDQNKKKELYLTYNGVLKLLFCARGDKAERFQKWAMNILFTMQMGNQDDRDKVAADALNVEHSAITNLFRTSSKRFPCVYLFEVGKVGDMRQHFDMNGYTNDNDIVYKYGMTSDMERRSKEHSKTYGKLKDNSFKLVVFSYIESKLKSKAETKLKHIFELFDTRVKDPKHNELIVLKKDNLTRVKELYHSIYVECSGESAELIAQIQNMEKEHQHQMERSEHQHQHQYKMERSEHQHQIELLKGQHQIELKDVELMYFRKMLENKQ